jgi:glycosyltransferase involved in cell wall biosynthesis
VTEQPLVSIIIPTFNRAHLIGETLDSVMAQTYTNWECIVVDDGSTDDTEALLKAYIEKDARFQYHKRPDRHAPGGSGARNYGFGLSAGDYVQWFDDDDVMLYDMLATIIYGFKSKTELVISSCKITNRDLKKHKIIDLKEQSFLFKDYSLRTIKIVTNNVIFKKIFFKERELFLEHLLRSQEADFFSRLFFELSEDAYEIINRPLFLYRQHDNSKTTSDKIYKPEFKYAHFYVHSENLKRGILLDDLDIIQFCRKSIILLLVDAIKNDDKYLVHLVIDLLSQTINLYKLTKIKMIIFLLQNTKYFHYKFKYFLLSLTFKK